MEDRAGKATVLDVTLAGELRDRFPGAL